jgi:hypothetical protein
MKKFRTVDGMKIELRKGDDSDFTSSVHVDDVLVGCDALLFNGCDALFKELTNDRTGEKARYVRSIV